MTVESLDSSGRAWFGRRDEPLLASLFSKAKERKSKRCHVCGRCMYSGAAKKAQICDLFLRETADRCQGQVSTHISTHTNRHIYIHTCADTRMKNAQNHYSLTHTQPFHPAQRRQQSLANTEEFHQWALSKYRKLNVPLLLRHTEYCY